MSSQGRWADLAPRVASAVVMIAIAVFAISIGSHVFHVAVALVCGAMTWELIRMGNTDQSLTTLALSLFAAVSLLVAIYFSGLPMVLALVAPVILAGLFIKKNRVLPVVFMVFIMLAGYEMTAIRDHLGLSWLVWLILVVVVSDVAGYFAGRLIGGPKFWPKISPKKTWSGTVAGWIGAGLIGLGFCVWQDAGYMLVPFSILTAFAAQMGDILESAIKRRMGVKDSSNLIPGHGGFLDRFDGMLGAAFLCLSRQPFSECHPEPSDASRLDTWCNRFNRSKHHRSDFP